MSMLIDAYRFGGGGGPASMSTVSWSATTNTTAHAVGFGSSLTNGERVIVQFVGRPGQTGAVSFPAGWTFLAQQAQSDNQQVTTYYRDADGSEGSSVTVTNEIAGNIASAHVYRVAAGSFNPASPPEITFSALLTQAPDPPSISPSWGTANVILIATYSARSNATPTTYPLPNGQTYTAGNFGGTGGAGSRCDVASCWEEQTGSSFNPGAFGTITQASNRGMIVQSIAIRR